MDKFALGIIAFPILFSMLALRMPIGLAMLIVGCSGTIIIAVSYTHLTLPTRLMV